jgi:hypothetical protein
MNRRLLAFGLSVGLAGCCAPFGPTAREVKSWVAADLPAGSSEHRVERFCASHGFDYSSGRDWGNAHRRGGGCGPTPPMVWMQVRYDDARRVTGIDVYSGWLEP